MAHDVVRLVVQLVGLEAGGFEEVLVEACDTAFDIGLGENDRAVSDRKIALRDRKILAHCHTVEQVSSS